MQLKRKEKDPQPRRIMIIKARNPQSKVQQAVDLAALHLIVKDEITRTKRIDFDSNLNTNG